MQIDKKNKTALHEIDGVKKPSTINPLLKNKKWGKPKIHSIKKIITEIKKGNISFLSKAITLVESANPKHQKKASEIIKGCLPYANNSIRIGITGVPGVGKSTFIEALGKHLIVQNKKIGILAIDPSSTLNKGSILGDKTRMETLVNDENVFIRPSAAGNSLGGVARKTRESIILCEAAGFDTIFIETVGVGQSETAVHSMVDFFLLLKVAGTGDELQGIKRGIIEMADAIIINKADNDNVQAAKLAKMEFTRALHLFPLREDKWLPKVATCSALHQNNIDLVWNIISNYLKHIKSTKYFNTKRTSQNKYWLLETINQQLLDDFYKNKIIATNLDKELKNIMLSKTSPFDAAEKLLTSYQKIINLKTSR